MVTKKNKHKSRLPYKKRSVTLFHHEVMSGRHAERSDGLWECTGLQWWRVMGIYAHLRHCC